MARNPGDALQVSVVMATIGRPTLARQLSALARQDFTGSWELVLADNRPDQILPLDVARFGDGRNIVIVAANQRRGPSYARNVGAAHANGSFLLFCDDDDEVDTAWVAAMERALRDAEFVVGQLDEHTLNDAVTEAWIPAGQTGPGAAHIGNLGFLAIAPTCNMGIRRELFQRIGGFDEQFSSAAGEDVDFSWRVQLAGTALVDVPEAIVHVQLRDSLNGVFKQGREYGESDAHLIALYHSRGCRRPTVRRVLKTWLWLLPTLPRAFSSVSFRGRWLRQAGYRIGRLQGSVRYRVFAL